MQAREVKSRRATYSKSFRLGGRGSGLWRTVIGTAPKHYFNHDGEGDGHKSMREIDTRLILVKGQAGCIYNAVRFRAPDTANKKIKLYDALGNEVIIQPHCSGKEYVLEGDDVVYKDAFGPGRDLIYRATPGGVMKLVRIRKRLKGAMKFEFDVDMSNMNGLHLREPRAWDENSEPVKVKHRLKDGVLTKIITPDAMKDAVGDIYTDATFTGQANINDGFMCRDNESGSWATVRGLTTADFVDSGSSQYYMKAYESSGFNFYLYRYKGEFDTSSIPDDDQIDDATYSVYFDNKGSEHWGSSQYIVLCEYTGAAALVTGSYDDFNATEFGRGVAPNTGWRSVVLNAAGMAFINKTGTTKFMMRTATDFDNSAPVYNSNGFSMRMRTANYTSTSYDPKLVINHSEASAGMTMMMGAGL